MMKGSKVLFLVVINVLIYIIMMSGLVDPRYLIYHFALIPQTVLSDFKIWQVFTYMFLHDPSGFAHILINMFILANFGTMIEQVWGSKKFLFYYLFCGTGAGVFILVISSITGSGFSVPTIGASGAIFGLLLAFAVFFPDSEILVMFVIPVKAKYFIIIYGGIELFLEISGGSARISHLGHLGGIVFGLIYFAVFEKMKRPKAAKRFERKMKKLKKEVKAPVEKFETSGNNIEMKKEILAKLWENPSKEALTDDEYQYVKYLDIVTELTDNYTPTTDVDKMTDEDFIRIIHLALKEI